MRLISLTTVVFPGWTALDLGVDLPALNLPTVNLPVDPGFMV